MASLLSWILLYLFAWIETVVPLANLEWYLIRDVRNTFFKCFFVKIGDCH
uniref:Uncharacterized protein n=1 Tax=Rhizophora mucronata TaxID=61149 RepID=A0A2P2PCC8_RHIMU